MNDLSETINGYYVLLKELTGVEKRKFDIEKDIPSIFLHYDGDDGYFLVPRIKGALESYISEHLADISPDVIRMDTFAVKVPLDRSRFEEQYSGDGRVFLVGDNGHTPEGIGVALYDEHSCDWSRPSKENLANEAFNAVRVSVWVPRFISSYEARMKDLQQLVGVLTGEVDGRVCDYTQYVVAK